MSRKKSLDRIVNEFLESSSFNLEHTAGLVSVDDFGPTKEESGLGSGAGRKKKVALDKRAKV